MDSHKMIAPKPRTPLFPFEVSWDKLKTLVLQLIQKGYRMLYSRFAGLAILFVCP